VPTNADAALIPPARPTRDELSEPLGWLNYYCIDERTHQNVWSFSKIFIKLRLELRFRLGVRVIAVSMRLPTTSRPRAFEKTFECSDKMRLVR
jgi:hypothetical protein